MADPDGPLVGRVLEQRFTRGGTTLLVDVDGLGAVGARTAGVEPLRRRLSVRLRLERPAVGVIEP